jgi:hypothetical protein
MKKNSAAEMRSRSLLLAMDQTELGESVRRLATVFERRNVRHVLIGGLAVGLRSRPRATKDADFILTVPALSFPGLLEEVADEGFEIDLMELVRRWSSDRLIVFNRGRVRIDWMQPVVPLYAHVLDMAIREQWMDSTLFVASPEGLILTKMVAFRLQDQADIVSILAANRGTINLDLIRAEWSQHAGTEAERTNWLERHFNEIVSNDADRVAKSPS